MGNTRFKNDVYIHGSVKTNQGSIAGLHGEFLQRIDTGEFEPAQEGIEYFSPEQQGGIYGKIVRQYFSGTTTTETQQILSSSDISFPMGSEGYVEFGTERLPFGYITSSGNYNISKARSTTAGLYFVVGPSLTSNNYSCWVDYVKISSISTSPGSLIQNIIDPTVLQRVDTGVWETAQEGVEYFSPDQHAIYGKVVRQYFSGNPDGATTIVWSDASSVARFLKFRGVIIDASDANNTVEINSYYSSASSIRLSSEYSGSVMQVVLRAGSAFDDSGDEYYCWVDYIKTTPPTLSPTGQPFADLSSPLFKRVDTGLWEIPQDGVVYHSKEIIGRKLHVMKWDSLESVTSGNNNLVDLTALGGNFRVVHCEGYYWNASYDILPLSQNGYVFKDSSANYLVLNLATTPVDGIIYGLVIYGYFS